MADAPSLLGGPVESAVKAEARAGYLAEYVPIVVVEQLVGQPLGRIRVAAAVVLQVGR